VTWLWASAGLMLLTAAVHSVLGEKRLIIPLLARDKTVLTQPLSRKVIRFAWHFTSLLMVVSAALIIWPGSPRELILFAGAAWLAVGLADAIYTRGQHVGWPLLSAAGLFALLGA
jgi:hypothetical protein